MEHGPKTPAGIPEIESYAPIPPDATEEEVAQHKRNFTEAMRKREEGEVLDDPLENLVRTELAIYLASHFDPRDLDAIRANVRAVLKSQMNRQGS